MHNPANAAKKKLHASQQVELDMLPADVWAIVSNYGAVHDWHPLVVSTQITAGTNNTPGAVRRLDFTDGGSMVGALLAYEPQNRLLRYSVTAGDLPVSDYVSTIEVKALPDPYKSLLTWASSFHRADLSDQPAAGKDDDSAVSAINGVYSAGLQAVKKMVDAIKHNVPAKS